MKRFIIIVLDGFGIGAMEDVYAQRPQDIGSNTCKHILETVKDLKLENLERLGLMNALEEETGMMKKSSNATSGVIGLAHYGADTFYGHQEIMGTKPVKPKIKPFQQSIHTVYAALKGEGYSVEYRGESLKFLLVNGCVTVADNIEADLGQAYNITTTLDLMSEEELSRIGSIVRGVVDVSRVIAFGGKNVKVADILNSAEKKEERYIGINAVRSGVYREGYFVIHMGYGVDPRVQIPTMLGKAGIAATLIGKVADIVENRYGKNLPCVDTEKVMQLTLNEMELMDTGLIAANVQETDLAGHSQDAEGYAEKLKIADRYIGEIIHHMKDQDILVIMADHGNDPLIGHNHHTREKVPLLIYGNHVRHVSLGYRDTLSDVGATAAEYFGITEPENGTSFLNKLYSLNTEKVD